jgi:Dynein heavy chain, N-terminal region 1
MFLPVSTLCSGSGLRNSLRPIEGTEIWVAAENAYNERVARVENQIISRLRDRLGTARNANEMFRVFSKFNALFVRPKVRLAYLSLDIPSYITPCQQIRGAIQEYQTQLIDSVKEDIKRLHDKVCVSRSFACLIHPFLPSSKHNTDTPKHIICPKCVTSLPSREQSSGRGRSNGNYSHT